MRPIKNMPPQFVTDNQRSGLRYCKGRGTSPPRYRMRSDGGCGWKMGLQTCSPHGAKRNAGSSEPSPNRLRFASSGLRWLVRPFWVGLVIDNTFNGHHRGTMTATESAQYIKINESYNTVIGYMTHYLIILSSATICHILKYQLIKYYVRQLIRTLSSA